MQQPNQLPEEVKSRIRKDAELVKDRDYNSQEESHQKRLKTAKFYGYLEGATVEALKAEELRREIVELKDILENRLTGPDADKFNASDAYHHMAKMLLGNQSGSAIESLSELKESVHELRVRAVSAERSANEYEIKFSDIYKENDRLRKALETIREGHVNPSYIASKVLAGKGGDDE